MPYSKTTLAQTGNALSLEMKALLDAALTASGKYTKVTNAYVSTTKTFDVWLNDSTTDGYPWYLIVATDTANTGRLYTGGCLEYSDTTKIAKKALRGTGSVGFVDASGYPTTTSGGPEMTFALGSFGVTSTLTTGMLWSAASQPTAAAAGNIFRVLVTGQCAWIWWGTAATVTACQSVGTYTNIHSSTSDLKPLAYMSHNNANAGGTVWQNPLTTAATGARSTIGSASGFSGDVCYGIIVGKVGPNGADMNYDGVYIGAREHLIRESANNANIGGGTNSLILGWSIGLAPADFIMLGRQSSCAIGDTVTIGGKTYESVVTPGTTPGLFVNTSG